MAKTKTKAASGHKPAGGLHSRNVVRPKYREGQQKRRDVPAGVAQIGQRQGNHITSKVTEGGDGRAGATRYGGLEIDGGAGFRSELGNSVAVRTAAKPGGSRTVMPSGSQCMTGPVNRGEPLTPKNEIFPGFGPRKG
jgi:hypothetical protein